jgi:hypothetical protein
MTCSSSSSARTLTNPKSTSLTVVHTAPTLYNHAGLSGSISVSASFGSIGASFTPKVCPLTRFQSAWPPVAMNYLHPTRSGARQRSLQTLAEACACARSDLYGTHSVSRFGPAHRNNDTPTLPATIAGWVITEPRLTTPKQAPSAHQALDCCYWLACQLTSSLAPSPMLPGLAS